MVYGSIYESSRLEGSFLPDYAGPDAPFRMVTESLETDQALFDIVIEHDFLEAAAANNVQLEATLQAIDEGFLGDMWGKIVELLKKIKDKIVSIAKAASVKISAFFTKDNKALVDKYGKQFAAADHSKITIKGFCKMRSGKSIADNADISYLKDQFTSAESATSVANAEKAAKDATVDKALGKALGKESSVSASSFTKEYRNSIFEDGKDVKASEISGHVTEVLTNYGNAVSSINDAKNKLTKEIDTCMDNANKKANEANTIDPNDASRKQEKELMSAQANACRTIAQAEQAASGKIFSAILDALKFDMKQSRKAYITIAAKGAPSVQKEDADLLEAELELEDYNVDSFFDQYAYDEEDLAS